MKADDERAAFLEAIAASPYDMSVRKIFADWLDEHDEPEEAAVQRGWTVEKQRAKEWLEAFANEISEGSFYEKDDPEYDSSRLSYDELMAAAAAFLDRGVGYCLPFDTPDCVWEKAGEFWENYRTLTGRGPGDAEEPPTFFHCAC